MGWNIFKLQKCSQSLYCVNVHNVYAVKLQSLGSDQTMFCHLRATGEFIGLALVSAHREGKMEV